MDLDERWRKMSDREVMGAASRLEDYTEEAQEAIRAEVHRRGLSGTSSQRAMAEPYIAPDSPYESATLHFRPRVILPRRIKADLVDGVIAVTIFVVPLLIGQAVAGHLPDALLRLSVLSIPAAILYAILRDSIGHGTSFGKRALGLRLIRLEDGQPCSARRVWARNLLDPIPFLSLIDFIWMCLDPHGQKLMDKRLRTQIVEMAELHGNA